MRRTSLSALLRTALVALCLFLASPQARAEQTDDWARGIGAVLGLAGAAPLKVERNTGEAGGVSLQLELVDLRASRFTGQVQTDATRLALQALAAATDARLLAEVRGAQLVLLQGSALSDPQLASELLQAAWDVFPSQSRADGFLVRDELEAFLRGPLAPRLYEQAQSQLTEIDLVSPRLQDYLSLVAGPEVLLAAAAPPLPEFSSPPPARTDPRRGPPPPVVLVALDERAEEALGPMGPSYRTHHAALIRRLNELGARGIAFDIYFPENPSQAEATRELAKAAANSLAPVVLTVHTEIREGEEVFLPNAQVLRAEKRIGEGATIGFKELVLGQGGLAAVAQALKAAQSSGKPPSLPHSYGEFVLYTGVSGFRPLVVELALRTGDLLSSGEPDLLGLVNRVPSGIGLDSADQPIQLTTPALRPQLSDPAEITRLSYIDILRGEELQADTVRGALVLVGVDDGVLDVIHAPNPEDAPQVSEASGVYAHVFLLRRLVHEAYAQRGQLEKPLLERIKTKLQALKQKR